MKDYMFTEHLIEERGFIHDIPIIRLSLKKTEGKVPTIILYHGWSSSKESQRLRGFILANLGYQVIIPDSIYHGERDRLENYGVENSIKYFWPTILNSMDEANKIIHYCTKNYQADPDRIGLFGHSMGGFISAAIFTYDEGIKTAVVLNSSFNWGHSNQILKKAMGLTDDRFYKEEEKLNSIDPINNLRLIVDRPLLLLHGSNDSVVNIESQRMFYDEIKSLYSDKSLIQLIEYSNLDHFVTTNMMEEAAIWFKKYL